jgi:hypothetical protein
VKIDGACHCGAIAYEAEIDPAAVRLCHCKDCQTMSGSAYRVAVSAAEGSFRLLSGEPKIYVKAAESGVKRAQAFCGTCGTPIYATSVGPGPKKYGLRVGAIRQRAELRPARQFWCRSALAWAADLRGMASFETE